MIPGFVQLERGPSSGDRRRDVVRFGEQVRERLSGRVRSVHSFELARFPYPVRYGLRDAGPPLPYLCIANRVFVVRYDDLEGAPRVLLVSPSDVERNAATPFFKGLADAVPKRFEPLVVRRGIGVMGALAACGVAPEEVDFITYDHLHTQDLRGWIGPAGRLPRAKLLVMRSEWEAVSALLPPQRPWYCPDGAMGIASDRVVLLDESVIIGEGVALIRTPGHTAGNHSIALHWGEGITVTSENGLCPDSYAPHESAMRGLRSYARGGMDVVLNGNTLELGLEQYLSMVLEKTIAGPSVRDSKFPAFLASSELTAVWYAPGIAPTLAYGDIAWSR